MNSKTVFYSGDVVELLNLSADQIESIRSQRCNFKINPKEEAVGMRYRVRVSKNHRGETIHQLMGWNHGGHFYNFYASQLLLYKRPLSNWVEHFLGKMGKSRTYASIS